MQHLRRRLVAGCAAGAVSFGCFKSGVACDEPNVVNVRLNDIPHIGQWCKLRHPLPTNPLKSTGDSGLSASVRDKKFVSMDPPEMVIQDIVSVSKPDGSASAFRRAGPHEHIVWDAHEVKAAIVTCGGLSPGLNNVIRGIVKTLHDTYGVPRTSLLGVQFGYRGFYSDDYVQLTPESVEYIHRDGGTMLGASRGGFDVDKIMDSLVARGINQVYVIGGDGTHRGAAKLYEESQKRGLKMAVVGIPKTIDNDIGLIDRSFGFKTCIEEACKVIRCARVEAVSALNGICIVKLMGRDSGFIAAHATMSSRNVDLCLIPEVPFDLSGDRSIFEHLHRVLVEKGSAVVVVAEGAGQDMLGPAGGADASGNKKYSDVGKWLADETTRHFKEKKLDVTVKYIDPSYLIRSVPANADDSELCMLLTEAAVHGAMAGFTGFSAGLVNNRTVLIPIAQLTSNSPRKLDVGRRWDRILSTTRQPN